jgi:hypothetical protein
MNFGATRSRRCGPRSTRQQSNSSFSAACPSKAFRLSDQQSPATSLHKASQSSATFRTRTRAGVTAFTVFDSDFSDASFEALRKRRAGADDADRDVGARTSLWPRQPVGRRRRFVDKPQSICGGGVVGRAGLEPATKGLCVPPRLSPPVSGSWSGLCLAFRPSRRVSTRSPSGASLGVGMAEISALAFTEFEKFYARAESTYPGQPAWKNPCASRRLGCLLRVLCSNQLS